MNAEKVNLCHLYPLFVDSHRHRNGWDERHEFLLIAAAHANQPFRFLIGQVEGPFEEWDLVVKTESVIHILHVMLRQKIVKLNSLSLIIKVYVWPVKAIWELECFSAYLIKRLNFNWTIIHRSIQVLRKSSYWLCVPEDMLFKKRNNFVDQFALIFVLRVFIQDFFQQDCHVFLNSIWVLQISL